MLWIALPVSWAFPAYLEQLPLNTEFCFMLVCFVSAVSFITKKKSKTLDWCCRMQAKGENCLVNHSFL